METTWDCIIVGGGAAGLSAALVLGRARASTLLVDAGAPSNAPAAGIGGLLGHDGRPPADLYAAGRVELSRYPSVAVRDAAVVEASVSDGVVAVRLGDGTVARGRRVVLATGMTYRLPAIDGLAERWGRSVFHCPFCHGWEVRDRPLGVLDGDPATGVHRALLLARWSDDVVLFTNGLSALPADERRRLTDAGIEIDERAVAAVRGDGEELAAVAFAGGAERRCEGLLVAVELHQRHDLAVQLGLATTATPVAADAVVAGPMGETSVPEVFVAGDVVAATPSVANAVAAGSNAAAAVVRSLAS